jgi:hypothetical protein
MIDGGGDTMSNPLRLVIFLLGISIGVGLGLMLLLPDIPAAPSTLTLGDH